MNPEVAEALDRLWSKRDLTRIRLEGVKEQLRRMAAEHDELLVKAARLEALIEMLEGGPTSDGETARRFVANARQQLSRASKPCEPSP